MRYHRLADIGPLAGNVTQFALLDLPTAMIPGAIPDSHENTLAINEAGEVFGGFFSGATSAGQFDEVAAAIEAIALLGFDPESFSDWLKEASEESADSACEYEALWVESKKGGA